MYLELECIVHTENWKENPVTLSLQAILNHLQGVIGEWKKLKGPAVGSRIAGGHNYLAFVCTV